MFRRNRQFYMNNSDFQNNLNFQNNSNNLESENIDTPYQSINYSCQNMNNQINCCECGFDNNNIFPDDPILGQSYVPYQFMDRIFKPNVGLKMGTIFPELVRPYSPGQSMREISYISSTNQGVCNQ